MVGEFFQVYGPERLDVFRTRFLDRALVSDMLVQRALDDNGEWLDGRLDREFMKDTLARRQSSFLTRSYDRTVHPTQVYSLQAEMAMDAIIRHLVLSSPVSGDQINHAAHELWQEFLGRNVSINSQQEADEIILDLNSIINGEDYAEQFTGTTLSPFLSFWSDWDGSNRPSGQGHRLVASVVMENVRRLAH
jgi:hypothetical protein